MNRENGKSNLVAALDRHRNLPVPVNGPTRSIDCSEKPGWVLLRTR
jgi:hypothetical protein